MLRARLEIERVGPRTHGSAFVRRGTCGQHVARIVSDPTRREASMADLQELLDGARDVLSVRRVVGDPVERNGVTLLAGLAVLTIRKAIANRG
jgi:hypothetical protein